MTKKKNDGLTFDPSIFKVPEDPSILVQLPGFGVKKFNLKPATLENIKALRTMVAAQLTLMRVELRDQPDDSDHREYWLRDRFNGIVGHIIRESVLPQLNEEQTEQLVLRSGGHRGELARKVVVYYGLIDLVDFIQVGATDDLPT